MAFETRSTTANFAQKHEKVENSSHYSGNPQNFVIFSSPKPSAIVPNSPTPFPATRALETRQKKADFIPKVEKVETSPNSTKTTSQTHSPSIVKRTDDVTRVRMSLPNHNNVLFHPTAAPTTASSSHLQVTGDGKSALLRAVFESQALIWSPAFTIIVSALKTRSVLTGFMKNHQKVENMTIFTQKSLEPPISTYSGLPTPSIAPTKHPCNLSDRFFLHHLFFVYHIAAFLQNFLVKLVIYVSLIFIFISY